MSYIIPIASILIAALALYVGWKNQKRIVAIEEARERDRLHEKRKANLTARIEREIVVRGSRQAPQYYLTVENHGAAEARDVNVLLDGQPVLQFRGIVADNEIRQVGPKSSFRYILALSMDSPAPSEANITWVDDSGEPGSYRTTLTS